MRAVAIWASAQYSGDEDVALALVENISSADPDAVKPDLAVLTAGHGNLSTTSANITRTEQAEHVLRFHGNWRECADALAQLVYTPNADWNGWDDISATAQYASDTTHEDKAVRIMGMTVTDVDAAADVQQLITAQLNCTDGRLSLMTYFEALFFVRGNGTLDADMAIRDGMDAINAALAVVEYLPDADWFGSALVMVQVADEGHTLRLKIHRRAAHPVTVVSIGSC